MSMKNRCDNPNAINYRWYGAKGIKVCKRWYSFTAFLEDMGERPVGLSLDRINGKKNYMKSNCRWATRKQQARQNSGKR